MPAPIRFVVDSTADLDEGYRSAHGISMVPLRVIFGDEELRDFIDIQPAEFYARMESDKDVAPRTSQPTPAEFDAAFREAGGDGATVICTTISSDMSGTWNSAEAARRALPDLDIRLIDSRNCGAGHQIIVRAAVAMAEAGADADAITAAIEKIKASHRMVFTLETLEYLRRGGRIGGARALLGSVLNIKPVLQVKDGKVDQLDKVRTHARALERVVDEVRQASEECGTGVPAIVCHSARPEAAAALAVQVSAYTDGTPAVVDIGPVIGCHGGPGVLGVTFHHPLPPLR